MTRCTNHCGACHRHFHSLGAFDAHRCGSFAHGRYCLSPLDLSNKLVAVTDHGKCDMYAEVKHDITIWALTRDLNRARTGLLTHGEAVRGHEREIPTLT